MVGGREDRTIEDARFVGGLVGKAGKTARLADDQDAGRVIPWERARMEREMRAAERDLGVLKRTAAEIAHAADPAISLERRGGARAGAGATVRSSFHALGIGFSRHREPRSAGPSARAVLG